ncbi:MAG: hypothetical protein WAL50_13520, partial [Kineosporiaceae bacterium]
MPPEPLLADPESDPAATWAVDPARARELVAAVVAGTDGRPPELLTTRSPFTGAPLAALPLSTPADVAHAVARARAVQPD